MDLARINASGKYTGRVVTEVRPFTAFVLLSNTIRNIF